MGVSHLQTLCTTRLRPVATNETRAIIAPTNQPNREFRYRVSGVLARMFDRDKGDSFEDKGLAAGFDWGVRRGTRSTDRKDRRTLASSSRVVPWEATTIRSSSMSSARRLRDGVPWMALGDLVSRGRQSWAVLSQPRTRRRWVPNPWGSRGQTLFCWCRDGMGMRCGMRRGKAGGGVFRDGRVVMVAFWKAGRRGRIHGQTYRYTELSEGVHLGFLAPGLWAVVGAGGRMGAKIRCESVRVLW